MRSRIPLRKLNWRTLMIVAAGVIEMFLLMLGGIKMLEFTDSAQFCGQLCHTPMNPEFKTYKISPHSQVQCATCHVGSGASYFVKSKVSGVPLIIATTFNTYPRPIPTPVENLRPARDTCEQCHWPQKFSEDRLKTYVHYSQDEKNTKDEFQLAFRVGGGEAGSARDIHWHITTKIWYLSLDAKDREIAWLGVETPDGTLTEYYDPNRLDQATPDKIAAGKKQMDCLVCHNRATHIFQSPDDLVDQSMDQGKIDASLPYIKKLAVDALDVENPSISIAQSKIAAIPSFYQQQYPDVYSAKQAAIKQAQATLTDLTQYVVFPEMRVTWETHDNNLSHDGCFRCHGKLTTDPKNPKVAPIVSDCSTCHYSVSISKEVTIPKVPHAVQGLSDCLSCHGPSGVKPVPGDHSGRGNSDCLRCHTVVPVSAPAIPHSIQGITNCLQCHAANGIVPVPADHAGRTSATCSVCHAVAANAKPVAGPAIPHTTQGVTNCLQCHGVNGLKPVPADHTGRTNDTCTSCHSVAANPAALLGPAIKHQIAASLDCQKCHGANGILPYPADHAGRANTTCTTCHSTAANAFSLSGPRIPADHVGRPVCFACHQNGVLGAPKLPTNPDHSKFKDTLAFCQACHTGP